MSRVRTLVGRTTALLLLTSGTVVAGSSSAYAADGTISGSVTAANRSITYGWVDLYAWDAVGQEFDPFDAFYISSTTTAKTFTFTVPPGRYALEFSGSRLPGKPFGAAWTLPETLAQPGVLDVTDGGSVRADVAYPALHTVSGTVSGARAGESEATLWRWEPSHNHFDSFDWEETRFNGSYSFDHAPAGIYTVEFERPRSGSALGERKWLGGNASKPSAPSGPGVFTVGGTDLVKNFNFDGPAPAPVATIAPAIPANATVGVPVTASVGAWNETPDLSFQWLRNGAAIPGATGTTYVPTAADAGGAVAFVVTATQANTHTGTARSGDAAVARLLSSTTAKPRKKKVDVGDKAKLKVVVRVPGVAAPTGTVKVSEGKKKVAKGTLVAADKGVVLIKVRGLDRGKHKLKVDYLGNAMTIGSKDKAKVKVVR